MIRDCQMVSSRDGTSEVMSGLIRLLSLQYHDVCSADSQCLCPGSPPLQMADVACASVPTSTAQLVTACALPCSARADSRSYHSFYRFCHKQNVLGPVTGIDGTMGISLHA